MGCGSSAEEHVLESNTASNGPKPKPERGSTIKHGTSFDNSSDRVPAQQARRAEPGDAGDDDGSDDTDTESYAEGVSSFSAELPVVPPLSNDASMRGDGMTESESQRLVQETLDELMRGEDNLEKLMDDLDALVQNPSAAVSNDEFEDLLRELDPETESTDADAEAEPKIRQTDSPS